MATRVEELERPVARPAPRAGTPPIGVLVGAFAVGFVLARVLHLLADVNGR